MTDAQFKTYLKNFNKQRLVLPDPDPPSDAQINFARNLLSSGAFTDHEIENFESNIITKTYAKSDLINIISKFKARVAAYKMQQKNTEKRKKEERKHKSQQKIDFEDAQRKAEDDLPF